MKNIKLLTALIGFALFTSPLHATLDNYFAEMETKGLPKVLIVGCGHSYEASSGGGNHMHPNCWTVNVDNPEDYGHKPQNTITQESAAPQKYWQAVKADAMLDITQHLVPCRDKFDVVVLERLMSKSLNAKFTLFNAAQMLKPGGQLVIESCMMYSFPAYDPTKNGTLASIVAPEALKSKNNSPSHHVLFCFLDKTTNFEDIKASAQHFYPDTSEQVIASMKSQLERFGVDVSTDKKPIKVADEMFNMGAYLASWGFENVLLLENAYQPWTANAENDIKTARTGRLLSATKSDALTKERMNNWQSLLRNFK